MQHFQDYLKHKIFIALSTTLLVFLVVLTVSVFVDIFNKVKQGRYIGQEIESKNTITVSGQGEVYAAPDLAVTSFSVVTEKKTVASAMSENSKKMNQVIEAVKKAGVDKKDLKTTSFNLYPRYEYHLESSIAPGGKRVLVGYEVYQSLQVKIRDMEDIGSVIQAATDAGANQTGDLSFTIDEPDELKAEARKEAIDQAREKAEIIAKQLKVSLVRVTNFSETSQAPRYDYDLVAKESAAGGLGGAAPEIETGENRVEVNVSVTYEIN